MRRGWGELILTWGLITLGLGSLFYALHGQSEKAKERRAQDAEKARIAAEQFKAKQERQCTLVSGALAVVASRGRADLAQDTKGTPACRRIEVEDCGYKVELLYELTAAGRIDLAHELGAIGEDCNSGFGFATKHGLAAFRDHHKILIEALEEERESRHGDDHYARPDDDYDIREGR